jgi:hypothetical protein
MKVEQCNLKFLVKLREKAAFKRNEEAINTLEDTHFDENEKKE